MLGHVFPLMRIGARHQEPVKRLARHLLAQRGETRWALVGPGGDVEGLKHELSCLLGGP